MDMVQPRSLMAALILLLIGGQAAAQGVTGTVLESATGGPVEGAFVRLLDPDGRQRAATISDTAGAFELRAPERGSFTIQVEQIGYFSATAPVEVGQRAATHVTIRLNVLAFPLEAVTAVARSRCRVRPETGEQTERIWQEARKALNVAAWADRSAVLRYELTTFRRTLDPQRRQILRASEDTATGLAFRPFETRPAEELMARGFIHPTAVGEYMFYAPDAHILLSDEFLSAHCFWVEKPRHARHRGMIGLAFEPVERRDVSDIMGVLWVDVRTGELRMLEYAYRRIPWDLPDRSAEGRVDFRRLPGGTWIIQRWFIRVPLVQVGQQGRGPRIIGFEEAGGDVRTLTNASGIRLPDAHLGTIHGVVYDSTLGRPRAGVRLRVAGSGVEAFSGTGGQFQLVNVPPGTHTIRAAHPAWDSVIEEHAVRSATVQAATITRVDFRVPTLPTLLGHRCGAGATTVVAGHAFLESPDSAVAGVDLVARWQEGAVAAERVSTTDGAGRFVFCDLPLDRAITLQSAATGYDVAPLEVRLIHGRTHVQARLRLHAVERT